MKQNFKRVLSWTLALLMALSLLPAGLLSVPAHAASGPVTGLNDPEIGVSYSGDSEGSWKADGTGITGMISTPFSFIRKKTTLTIKNNKNTSALLMFDYVVDLQGGTVKVADTEVSSGGSYSGELAAGGSIKIYLKSGSTSSLTTIQISNILLIASDVRVKTTFSAPECCSYVVNGNELLNGNSSREITQNSTDAYQLKAYPTEGYRFLGWYNLTKEQYISTEAETSMYFDTPCTITARFAAEDAAIFETGGQPFADLGEAISYASEHEKDKITLIGSGSIDGAYTIPKEITLLIPFDEAGTTYTDVPGYTTTEDKTRTAFRKLTMGKDASITVQGAISVGGKHYTCSSAKCCKTTGSYGQIQMDAGSSITLGSDAKLYAWGYITGDGQITANSGAEVYEYFQIMDWRGGSYTAFTMNGNKQKVFPFSQYYVQNIEAALTICYGAQEYAYATIANNNYTSIVSTTVQFVGNEGSLFLLGNGGSFTKRYDEEKDRMRFEINGAAHLDSIVLTVMGVSVDSSSYVLPINNNVDMQILSGTTTVSKDAALLPGVTVSIAKGAELKVAEGANLYVYAAKQWSKDYVWGSNNLGISPVAYSPSHQGSRTVSDATIDVNGTLTAAGAIYTTASGANICSSKGTGVYRQVAAPGTATVTYQANQSAKSFPEIPITPAKLRNGDGRYVETTNYHQGSEIKYEYNAWGGKPAAITVSFDANGGSGTMLPKSGTAGQNITLPRNCFTYANHTFTGWNTAADGTGTPYDDGATVFFTEDTTLYAQWTQKPVVTFDANGGDGSMSPQTVEPNAATPLIANAFTRADYDFTGWNTAADGSGTTYADQAAVTLSGNCTLYAQWTLRKYHVRWLNWNGDVLQEGDYTCEDWAAWDDGPNPNPTPTRPEDENYTYKFANRWVPYSASINGWGFNPHQDVDFTAQFNQFKKLTVTFDAGGGTGTMDSVKILNGSTGTYYTLPFCRFTAPQGQLFDGWLITGTVSESTWDEPYELRNEKWNGPELLAFSDLTLKASWACSHTWDDGTVTTPATCSDSGVKTFTCSACNATRTETIPASGHQWEDATCTAPKTCSVCKITEGEANGHTEVVDAAVAATCTETGKTEGKHCSVCNAVLVAQKEVPANGHTEVIDEAVAATCTEPGKTEGKHCSVCNEVLAAQTEIPAKGHTEVVDAAVEPTCTKPGKTEGKHCSVCNTVTIAQTEIPAKGHTEVTDAAVEPTCTEPGKTEGKHCSVCNTVLAAQKEIPALNHAWKTEWEKNGEKHWHKCSRCNAVDAEAAHTFGKWRVTKAADYVTPGEKTHTCSVCNAAETEDIPSILQQLQEMKITAAEDGYTMTLPTGKKVLVLLAGYSQAGQLKSIQVLSADANGKVTFTRPDSEKAMLFFLQEDYKPLCSRKVTQ